ncbi:hypothetical protein [Bacillus altitudinis]|uniref:hypothetical protein n=1 Tax=Bacillus altitudinis TaxID=293387 RepID=UPI002DB9965E|nr:hypothetical protein [Bacillus altitudinis]MCS3486074.1 very-short-patch-repair endonuclease [Bacillus sp. JUb11]
MERNVKRDKEVTAYYLDKGWQIKRIWEHQVKEDFNQSINDIISFIDNLKISHPNMIDVKITGENKKK